MTKPAVYGAIDLGTNSFRLLIAALSPAGTLQALLAKELVTVRLGQGMETSGQLSPAAMERGRKALARFALLLAAHQPKRLRVCGTHALRTATNSATFLHDAAAILGQVIETISGEEEAALALAGASHCFAPSAALVLADVGGGSSELVWQGGSMSVPLGAVTLTERFLPSGSAPDSSTLDTLRATIAEVLLAKRQASSGRPPANCILVGSGGTATALAALDLGLAVYDENRVQGHRLALPRLRELIGELARLDAMHRNQLPGLDQGRGEIILAGALIYEQLLMLLGHERFTVSDAGLLEGILLSTAPECAAQ